jgi:2-dehydro-3-deoxyphosphogalactonate aldolase
MPTEAPLAAPPLIAILRRLEPSRAVDVATTLYDAGIRMVEVPLNSREPFASIAALAGLGRRDWLIGAGTVLTVEDVRRTRDAGGGIIISPNCNTEVIRASLDMGLQSMPGIATATEAFSAVHAGARLLKLFPAITYRPEHLQALAAVLPSHVSVFPVGGIGASDIAVWLEAGAAGFGFGAELYKPSYSLTEIGNRAERLIRAFSEANVKSRQQ